MKLYAVTVTVDVVAWARSEREALGVGLSNARHELWHAKAEAKEIRCEDDLEDGWAESYPYGKPNPERMCRDLLRSPGGDDATDSGAPGTAQAPAGPGYGPAAGPGAPRPALPTNNVRVRCWRCRREFLSSSEDTSEAVCPACQTKSIGYAGERGGDDASREGGR